MSSRTRRVVAAVLVVAVAAAALALVVRSRGGEDDDRFADYCAEVERQRGPLGEALAAGAETGLLEALPILRELADAAPDDIADEWSLVVARIADLDETLREAGADPATYDRADPPADVSDADRAAIDGAAAGLSTVAMRRALAAVEQQARDVCGTPLSL